MANGILKTWGIDMHGDGGNSPIDRRTLLRGTASALLAGVAVGTVETSAQEKQSLSAMPAFHAGHELKPLPYAASALNGLSTRIVESHWSNNYGGSVRALNAVNQRINEALDDDELPAFIYNDLKREHLMRTGSVVLHELYFDNLGGNGRADQVAREMLGNSFGSYDRWETEFRRIAAGLGGGSGWVVLGYNRHFGTLENYWMADHMHSSAETIPLLVMDMYEHSYQMDFGAATARYIDAFFANINWEQVLARTAGIV